MKFTFGKTGEITEVFTPGRYRFENGKYVASSWGAICRRYEDHAGIRIPADCEVYWKIDNQLQPYWRGEIVDVEYDFDETKAVFRNSDQL